MSSSSSYSFSIIAILTILAIFAIVSAGISTRLAVRSWNGNSYVGRAGAALLAFDGYFIFLWSIIVITLLMCLGNLSKGFGKWVAGPLSLMIQAFLLWALSLAGAAALSARSGWRCSTNFNTFWNCTSLYRSAIAFGWMTFIMLSILLMVLPYFLIAGYYDEEESIGRQSRSIGPATQANEKGVEVQEKQHENPPFQQEAPNAYPTPHVATQN